MTFLAVMAASFSVAAPYAIHAHGEEAGSQTRHKLGLGGFLPAVASAYSRHSSGPTNGCDGSRLHDRDLSVATFLVPCGARLRICLGRRCVTATRRDSGPYVAGRDIDVNVGVCWALGVPSATAWGVRQITWRRLR